MPGVRADSLRTSGARACARRLPPAEDKVRSRRPRSLGTGRVGGEAGRACARLRPHSRPRLNSGLGLPRPLRALTIVVDPGRLQELHCSAAAAAGLRREPRPSARPGHGATAAASSRAALRPPPAPRPQRRRAIAGPRPPPPPQPPPALGRRRRRHSRIPCAAPPPAAPGQRRKSRRAPAKSPRRETAPHADGAARAPSRAGARQGDPAWGPPRARPPPRG